MDDPMKPGFAEIGQEAQLIAWRKQKRTELLELRTSFSEEQQLRASETIPRKCELSLPIPSDKNRRFLLALSGRDRSASLDPSFSR
jgi:hypothetical protein